MRPPDRDSVFLREESQLRRQMPDLPEEAADDGRFRRRSAPPPPPVEQAPAPRLSRVQELLSDRRNLAAAVLLSEIIGPPRALR